MRVNRENLAVFFYGLLMISPSVMFYMTKGYFNLFTPVFIAFQLSLFLLFLQLLVFRKWIILWSVPLIILTVFQWVHFSMFGSQLSEGAIAAVLATNRDEAIAFIGLISWPLMVVLLLMLGCILASLAWLPSRVRFPKIFNLILLAVVLLTLGFRSIKHHSLYVGVTDSAMTAHPFNSVVSIYKGINLLNDYRSRLAGQKVLSFADQISQSAQGIHVLFIGESSRRHNWWHYGYTRDTNPYTENLVDQLYFFDNVVAIANSTIPALYRMLTFEENQQVATLMDVAAQAGLKTFWFSNQQQFGVYDNPTSALAQRADQTHFIKGASTFDQDLLPVVSEVIGESGDNKLIIVHVMGSHGYYHMRYPSEFNQFRDCKDLKLNDKQIGFCQSINAYDNSIRYTDWLVAQLIKTLEDRGGISSFTYISDHGENLYPSDGVPGHGGTKISSKEVEIPLMLWFSKKYKNVYSNFYEKVKSSRSHLISAIDFLPSYLAVLGLSIEMPERINFFDKVREENRFIYGPNNEKVLYKDIK